MPKILLLIILNIKETTAKVLQWGGRIVSIKEKLRRAAARRSSRTLKRESLTVLFNQNSGFVGINRENHENHD